MIDRGERRRRARSIIAGFAAWPPGAPGPVRQLLQRRDVRGLVRRMPKAVGRQILRPLVSGTLPEGGRGLVCIVSHSFAASGAPKVVLDIAIDLMAADYRVVVLSHADGPYRSILAEAGALVIIDQPIMGGQGHALALLRHADAVICNTVFCRPVVDAVAADVPVFWYTHEATLIGAMLQTDPSLAGSFRAARAVWAVSERAATFIRPGRPDVAIVVPGTAPLLDKAAVPPLPGGGVKTLAVFAGIEARKGHDLLASALASLPPDARARLDITVYGEVLDAAYADAWRRSIAGLANYRYAGPLPPREVAAKMVAADGVLVPSRDEPLPLVAVEVLSVARVLLLSRCCGIAHALADGESAFVAEDCTPEALAAMLARALDQADRWPAIAEAGYAAYQAQFTRAAMSGGILAAIEAAVAARG